MIIALISDFKNSIKSPDTEEKIDLFIYRPLGFLIAKVANVLKMTPTMLSILGLVCGIMASFYYWDFTNVTALMWGSIYFLLSGIFDSSDGQLARISNQSTKWGLILDGICDSLVIIAIYISCSWPYLKSYGAIYSIIVVAALYMHSYQCAILDFYHREYLYFGYGKIDNDTYWNPSLDDGNVAVERSTNRVDKILNYLRLTWIKKQQFLTTRTDVERKKMRQYLLNANDTQKSMFMQKYKEKNLWLLPYWRLIGVNAHTILIIGFMYLRRFDLYLLAFDIIIFNLIIFIVGNLQRKSDHAFMRELNDSWQID